MPLQSRHRLPDAIEHLDAMPAVVESRDRLIRVLLDPSATTHDLVTAVESDVALVVLVMRLANEKRPRKIGTVAHAIELLAPAGVETLARAIATYEFFDRLAGWALPPERFRLHAISVAGTVDMLAREIDHPRRDELLVAALLHDIGKVVMAEAYPEYRERMMDTERSPDERAQAEAAEHGMDHALIGGVLLRRWRLPSGIARAVERHHAPDAEGDAAVVRFADMLSHYGRGSAVRPDELYKAAGQLGIGFERLQSLLYRLPDWDVARRHATVPSPLSGKERDVLRGLASGKVYKEIGAGLQMAPSTVRSHLHNVYRKLGATDRAQAVLIASREGWL
ncbi:MAG TPA: HDOD domain-containing protein [Thermoleophilaceae bacterium]|nr:HDOD domain-containing protein [Thermoleophilaceae bacterium]